MAISALAAAKPKCLQFWKCIRIESTENDSENRAERGRERERERERERNMKVKENGSEKVRDGLESRIE